jgi:hypothetical protein
MIRVSATIRVHIPLRFTRRGYFSFAQPAMSNTPGDTSACWSEGAMTESKIVDRSIRIEEIVGTEGGAEPGWYYGRSDANGDFADKVGPFQSREEAVRHLEEELFGDDEG